jgi:ATP-dependent helicase/nuclease subunit B
LWLIHNLPYIGNLAIFVLLLAGLSDKLGAATKETIAYLANGVRRGHYFIHPGEHCGNCDVATICRKNHPPSLWRAENDPLTEPHYALHAKDPKKL